MNDSIHLHIILLYNLFPFQVLFLCILKVRMIQIRTSYYCSCNRKLLSIFRSQVASGHLDKTVRFWDIRWEYVRHILREVVDNLMDNDLLSMWAVPRRTMGKGERGEGSLLTPSLIIFFFALSSAFALLNLLLYEQQIKKPSATQAIIETENELHTNKCSLTE